MGQHPSAIADDGQSSIHRQAYTVRGDLYSRSVTASTIHARVICARRIVCQTAQISRQEPLRPQNYPNTPHRAVTAHTLNADTIYADEINCKTLRCYDVYVGEGEQWQAKRIEWVDRNRVGWDGKEDDESESSDEEGYDARSTNKDRDNRKKMLGLGAAGALGLALGGAALAYNHHRKSEKEEEEKELRRRQEEAEKHRREEDDRRHKEDDDHRRRDEEDRRRREEEDRRQHQQHQQPIVPMGHGSSHGRGDFHCSSRDVRLWSDGNHCFLVASCDAGDGRWQESRLDLDEIVTNRNGEFAWVHRGETGNFSGSAERWEIIDGGSVMVADLRKGDGSMQRRRFTLSDRITNEHGHLKYLD